MWSFEDKKNMQKCGKCEREITPWEKTYELLGLLLCEEYYIKVINESDIFGQIIR